MRFACSDPAFSLRAWTRGGAHDEGANRAIRVAEEDKKMWLLSKIRNGVGFQRIT